MIDAFLRATLAEYSCLPLKPGAKQPLGPWKRYQFERADAATIAAWRREGLNVGIVCGSASGIVVIDFDDRETGEAFVREHRTLVRTVVVTRRGLHVYFRGERSKTRFAYGDVQGEGSYVVAPGSIVAGHVYDSPAGMELVPPAELPAWDDAYLEWSPASSQHPSREEAIEDLVEVDRPPRPSSRDRRSSSASSEASQRGRQRPLLMGSFRRRQAPAVQAPAATLADQPGR